ncbi:hypothetical protein [Pedobacter miscanthi]|uniref:hypothetical protein n=1 Tax=Pedobacter miscanthi TaxID=2259170 RepID=UPI00292F6E01|nr:hypothetical protein [Pedobacter miscanthi]
METGGSISWRLPVPLFAATKAEKAFGFRVNRVYLTKAREQTLITAEALRFKKTNLFLRKAISLPLDYSLLFLKTMVSVSWG